MFNAHMKYENKDAKINFTKQRKSVVETLSSLSRQETLLSYWSFQSLQILQCKHLLFTEAVIDHQ
jgi:hypothetical protein